VADATARLVDGFADSGQDFHHRGVISGGVAGYSFQGVDGADAHVGLFGAKVLDRLGVAVGHLPLLSELDGELAELDGTKRQLGGLVEQTV
jgi:hypothetical protein